MPRSPYPNFPFPFYRNYSRSPSTYNSYKHNMNNITYSPSNTHIGVNPLDNCINSSPSISLSEDFHKSPKHENFRQKNKSNKNNEDYLFDLFGLKIYSDDVLLVSLIYFLYSEGVKDDGLFIVLILLLLS